MDKNRNYILDRISSKKTSIAEFNFDALQAPPLGMFFTLYDIQELNSIAKSIKYSANPEARYAAIDRVCKRRGLIKFASGTNRVVYRHPEFPDILFKIASDNIGLNDNPSEFKNQFFLKPFVCKIYEVSPCGTVALVERVTPITSREEFISVADDVFTLITEWLVGEYVLADIGSTHFMNYGIRGTFGIVLVDYPYCYKLDGNKLYCRKKDPTSPTGTCDGEIDYNNAFSHLVCTKCGAKYRAKELELKMKASEITTGVKEKTKMKIKISGGTKSVNGDNETRVVGTDPVFAGEAAIIRAVRGEEEPAPKAPVNPSTNKVKVSFGGKPVAAKEEYSGNLKVNTGKKVSPVFEPADKYVNGVSNKKEEMVPVLVEEKVVEKPLEVVQQSGLGVIPEEKRVSPVVEDAIEISEAIKEESVANAKPVVTKGPAEIIDEAVASINEQLKTIDIDALKEDCIYRLIEIVSKNISASGKAFKMLIKIANSLMGDIPDDEFEDAIITSELVDIITHEFKASVEFGKLTANDEIDGLDLSYAVKLFPGWDDDEVNSLATLDEDTVEIENIKSYFVTKEEKEERSESNPKIDKESYRAYHAKIVQTRSIFPGTKSKDKLIVFMDDNEQYLTVNGKIAAASDVDDKDLDMVSVVSTDWLDNVNTSVGVVPPTAEEISAAEEAVSEEE